MTYQHKIKCMNCSLHFTAYSHKRDWKPTGGCPECGENLAVGHIHWLGVSEKHIYQHVPGDAMLVSIESGPFEQL